MRLEDREVANQQELFDRQDEAEARRMQREASAAFAARTDDAASHHQRTTVLSAKRQDEVALARAIISALGTDGYEALSYPIGADK